MNTMITIGDALWILIGFAIFVFIIFLILLINNLIRSLKSLNNVLDDTQVVLADAHQVLSDTQVITGAASKATLEMEETVTSFAESSEELRAVLLENHSIVVAIASAIKALLQFRSVFKSAK